MATITERFDAVFEDIQPLTKIQPQPPTAEEVELDVEQLDRQSVDRQIQERVVGDVPSTMFDKVFGSIQPIAADHRKPEFQPGAEPIFTTEEGIEYSPYDLPISEARKLQAKPKPTPKVLRVPSAAPPEILRPRMAVPSTELEDPRQMNILMDQPTPLSARPVDTKVPTAAPSPVSVQLQELGFKFKPGLEPKNYEVREEMIPIAVKVKEAFASLKLDTPMITSARRHKKKFSFHEIGLGMDFRVNNIKSLEKRQELYNLLLKILPKGADIMKSEMLPEVFGKKFTSNTHLHIEMDTQETKQELIRHAESAGIKIPAKYRKQA